MKKLLGLLILVIVILAGGFYFMTSEEKTADDREKMTIGHHLGTTEVVKNPKNIVVFDYGIVDVLNGLNIEIAGLPKASLPKFLESYSDDKYVNVGDLKEPNLEKIYEMKPELIIISGRQDPYYDQLSKIAPTLPLRTNSEDYLDSFKTNYDILGKLFSKEQELNNELVKIEEKLANIKDKVKQKNLNALVLLSNNGNLSSYGLKSRFGIIYDYFGFEPVVEEGLAVTSHGNKINYEYILEKNPDYIFVVDRAAVAGGDVSAQKAFDNDIIKATKASQDGNIVFLDPEIWYTATGGTTTTHKMIDEVQNSLK